MVQVYTQNIKVGILKKFNGIITVNYYFINYCLIFLPYRPTFNFPVEGAVASVRGWDGEKRFQDLAASEAGGHLY